MGQHFDTAQATEHIQKNRLKKRWQKIVVLLAALVASATFFLLILPAVTMENSAESLECQLDLHVHTEACRDTEGMAVCGYADFAVHTHDSSCYGEDGALICPLKEIQAHTHGESCYQETPVLICGRAETAGHTHTEECRRRENVLTCGREESEGHEHTEACYEKQNVLVCAEEHEHTEICYQEQSALACDLEIEGHIHTADCYEEQDEIICGQEEAEGHAHTGACYEYRKELCCGQEEIILHTHNSSCFDADGKWSCGKIEVKEHTHDETCLSHQSGTGETAGETQGADSFATVSKSGFTGGVMRLSENSAGQNEIDFTQYITGVTVARETGGQWIPDTEFTNGDSIKVEISYSIPEGVVQPGSETIYYQLPEGIRLSNGLEGDVTIGGENAGRFTISQEGLIRIVFTDEFADGTPFTGELSFQGSVTTGGGAGEETIDFGGDGGTIIVKPGLEETDLFIEKEGNYQKENNRLSYTVTAYTQNGTDGDVVIQDVFLHSPDYGTVNYDADSFEVARINANGERTVLEPSEYQLTVRPQTEGAPASFDISGLPELAAGEAYQATYEAVPDLDSVGAGNGYLEFSNRAVAEDETHRPETLVTTKISLSMVSKEGSYSNSTRKFSWTVLVNEDQRDISGWELKDTMTYTGSDGQEYPLELPDTVTVTAYDGWNQIGTAVISLPYTFPEGSRYRYVVTYETDLPEGVDPGEKIQVHNKAELGKYESTVDVDVTIPPPMDYGVSKTLASSVTDGGALTWESTLTYPDEGTVDLDRLLYVDRIIEIQNKNSWDFSEGSHYTTLGILYSSLYVAAGNIALEYGTDYMVWALPESESDKIDPYAYDSMDFDELINLPWKDIMEFGEDEHILMFGIQFQEAALDKLTPGQRITIWYKTQLDWERVPTGVPLRVANYARIQEGYAYSYADATISAELDKQVSADWDGEADSSSFVDGPLTVDLDETGGILHYRLLLYRAKNTGEITVTDVLPAGAALVEDSVKLRIHLEGTIDSDYEEGGIWIGEAYYETGNWLRSSRTENDDGTTTVTFTIDAEHQALPDGCILGIYYDVSVAGDEIWQGAESAEKTYTNYAVYGETRDSTETTVEKVVPNLKKEGEQVILYGDDGNPVNTDDVRYYVIVNPEGKDLNPYENILTLEDTLTAPDGTAASFKPDSVKVYRYDGAAGEDNHYCGDLMEDGYSVSYDQDTCTITFTLQDETPCVVIYEYTIDRGTAAGDLHISNSAALRGQAGTSSGYDVVIEEDQAAGSVNRASMTIYKFDSGNITELLPGATFRLERYERQEDTAYRWEITSVTAMGEDGKFIVGESGTIILNFLSETSLYNTLYRITELDPPQGYLASDVSYYFVWMERGADEDQTIREMQESGAFGEVSPDDVIFIPYSTSGSLYVPNDPDRLTVTKEWRDKEGKPLETPPVDSVQITLYQWLEGEKAVYDTANLRADEGWSCSWSQLPKADENGRPYSYTVEEEALAGFEISYSSNNEEGVQTGSIVITNTRAEGYVLPETGGGGSYVYRLAGLFLVAAFCGIYPLYLCRRRGREGSTPRR